MSKKKWVISGVIGLVVIILAIFGYQSYANSQQASNAKFATTLVIKKLNQDEYSGDTKKYLKPYTNKNVDIEVVPVSDYSSSNPKFYVTVNYSDLDMDKTKHNYKEVPYEEYSKVANNDEIAYKALMKIVDGKAKFYIATGIDENTLKFKEKTNIYLVDTKSRSVHSTSKTGDGPKVYTIDSYKTEQK
ncbi:efflux transporter, RND family, MFP subunit [Weissella oryzae SG25]|uniref:Efflux transporter, RND family, MFP subunit n=1 Tax=Weissella oryzae (strain DSM 25784 / JCM 18191 / LMG 30913 / SG25) TaxID=1329250 RepID=A0A069D0A1_WEIOS|nr:hypothetical protein [Weissella oryzae]GAK30746.1 efflux transporter, RND family, MFP subunit [Weissella oryzae SG25]